MKKLILVFILLFGINSFGNQEDTEYYVVYDNSGRMFIYRNITIGTSDGSKGQVVACPIDPRDLPNDYELVWETKWEMTSRILSANKGILLGLILMVPLNSYNKEIEQDTSNTAQAIKNASEDEKPILCAKFKYEQEKHPSYQAQQLVKSVVGVSLSVKALYHCYNSISQGPRRKLIKKITDNNQKEE